MLALVLGHGGEHFGDGGGQTDEDGAADDVVADVQFAEVGNAEERGEIGSGDAVSGIDLETEGMAVGSGGHEPCQFFVALSGGEVRVGTCVEFDHVRADLCSGFDLGGDGIDEERDPGSGVLEPLGGGADGVAVGDDVETAFRGDLLAVFGDEAGVGRSGQAGDADDLRGVAHFEVEGDAEIPAEEIDIAILDMASVFAEVDRDGMSPGILAGAGGGEDGRFFMGHAGSAGVASLPESDHVVYIDAEFEHGSRRILVPRRARGGGTIRFFRCPPAGDRRLPERWAAMIRERGCRAGVCRWLSDGGWSPGSRGRQTCGGPDGSGLR